MGLIDQYSPDVANLRAAGPHCNSPTKLGFTLPRQPLEEHQHTTSAGHSSFTAKPLLYTSPYTTSPTCDATCEEVLAAVVEALIHQHSTHAVHSVCQAAGLAKGSAVVEAAAQHTYSSND